MNVETRFALWLMERNFVRLANVEGVDEYTDLFANYQVENGRPVRWTVCMDDEIVHGRKVRETEKAADIRDMILEWVARYGIDIRYRPQYILSPFAAGVKECKRFVLQSITEFGEDSRYCEETYIFTFERDRTIVADLNAQTYEVHDYAPSYGKPPRVAKFSMDFLAKKFSAVEQEEQQVWYDTRRLAGRIGWDERKISTYWRRGAFPFPTTFSGELPKWNEEKKLFVGGRSPRWTEKQVQIIMRRLDF